MRERAPGSLLLIMLMPKKKLIAAWGGAAVEQWRWMNAEPVVVANDDTGERWTKKIGNFLTI